MIISGERQIDYPALHARITEGRGWTERSLAARDAPVAMMLRNDFALSSRSSPVRRRWSRPWYQSTGI